MREHHWSGLREQVIAQTRVWDAELQRRKKQFEHVVIKLRKGSQESLSSARNLTGIVSVFAKSRTKYAEHLKTSDVLDNHVLRV